MADGFSFYAVAEISTTRIFLNDDQAKNKIRELEKSISTIRVGESEHVNFIELYNVQLRALTGGDPTKEKEVLSLNCWRALTELDAKAREAEELEKIRKKT